MNYEHRNKHNQRFHKDLLKKHTNIKWEKLNAPKNPFETGSSSRVTAGGSVSTDTPRVTVGSDIGTDDRSFEIDDTAPMSDGAKSDSSSDDASPMSDDARFDGADNTKPISDDDGSVENRTAQLIRRR